MVFSSTIFLFLFLPFTILGYYLINPKYRNILLLIVSIFFYAWGEPKFVFVMLASIFMNYLFGLLVDKYREKKNTAHFIIFLMVLFNVIIFFIFKYLNFTIKNLNIIFNNSIPQTNILLPIGISFFTFQAMSYVFDVYSQRGKMQKNPLHVALYVTFFPQLIAGPIVRYETISDAIDNRKETLEDVVEGVKRFIIGLSKKVIISNSIAVIADRAFSYTEYNQLSVELAWLGALAYSMQIYFDFSGYSDMAIGLAKIFGFHFDENFYYPYISKSISEFWRRWHISLSTWFRDYVYFPLGGSRVEKKGRLVFNLFIVWLLTGVWHGASWNFIIWGLFYFVLLVFEKLTKIPSKFESILAIQLYRIFTLLCVLFGWVIFRAVDMKNAISYIGSMFGLKNNTLTCNIGDFLVRDYEILFIITIILCTPLINKIKKLSDTYIILNRFSLFMTPIIYVCLFILSISYILNSSYNPFIYFNF